MPDWDASYATTDPAAFTADALGFAELEFEFPASCRFPGLAVRAGDRGLIFPRKGRTFATAPEIATALWLGAKITIIHGAIVPWQNNDMRPLAPVLCEWINRRAEHEKGTLQNEMFKLLGNSLYGKVGQGLGDGKAFDTREEEYQPIGPSKLTNAYFAAYVTGLVRAELAELAAVADGQIISMTTDALLMRGALRAALGPSSAVMSTARVVLSGDPELLEVKGQMQQLLSFRTRGVLTLQPLDGFIKIARGGMKAPDGIWSPRLSSAENEKRENSWFIEHLLFRHPGDNWAVRHPSSFSKMHRNSDDHRYVDDWRKANFEYDFKRCPVNVRPAYIRTERVGDVVVVQHIAFDTKPWNTVEEFNWCRDAFERWRRGDPRRGVPGRMLKTIRDWHDFVAFWQGAVPSAAGIRRSRKGPLDQARCLFIRLYVAGLAGLPGSGYEAAAKMLTEAGYPTRSQDFKDAKRRTKALPDCGVIPAEAEGVTTFVAAVQRLWPPFDAARLLQRPDDPGT